jgi:hypothetical protein
MDNIQRGKMENRSATDDQTCSQCGNPIGPKDLVCQRCGVEAPRAPSHRERTPESLGEDDRLAFRLTLGKVLVFIGGAVILIAALLVLRTPFFIDLAFQNNTVPASVVEALFGSIVIVCGMMADEKGERNVSLGAMTVLFSLFSFFTPSNGLFIGPALSALGGLLIISVRAETTE